MNFVKVVKIDKKRFTLALRFERLILLLNNWHLFPCILITSKSIILVHYVIIRVDEGLERVALLPSFSPVTNQKIQLKKAGKIRINESVSKSCLPHEFILTTLEGYKRRPSIYSFRKSKPYHSFFSYLKFQNN